jgi:hypothetical protein
MSVKVETLLTIGKTITFTELVNVGLNVIDMFKSKNKLQLPFKRTNPNNLPPLASRKASLHCKKNWILQK